MRGSGVFGFGWADTEMQLTPLFLIENGITDQRPMHKTLTNPASKARSSIASPTIVQLQTSNLWTRPSSKTQTRRARTHTITHSLTAFCGKWAANKKDNRNINREENINTKIRNIIENTLHLINFIRNIYENI
jgi:hypothetical protein